MENFYQNADTATTQQNVQPSTAATVANQESGKKGKKGQPATPPERKKRKPADPMWGVLTKARKKLDAQLAQSNEAKLKCIESLIGGDAFPDKGKFWAEFIKHEGTLLDSVRFHRDCKNLGLTPEIVAEHIVVSGSAMINKVLKYGIENTISKYLPLYTERFTSPTIDALRGKTVVEVKVTKETKAEETKEEETK